MEEILFSFIIPAYNAEKVIGKCLQSICSLKDLVTYEAIVVNDGSSDNTEQISKQYADKNVNVISIKNGGVSNARNIGIKCAKGKYIVFVDADDKINASSYLEFAKKISDLTQIYMFAYIKIGKERKYFINPPFESGIYSKNECQNMIEKFLNVKLFSNEKKREEGGHVWRYIFCTEFIRKNKIIFDNQISYAEDLCFCIKAFNMCEYFQVDNEVGYEYYLEEGTASRKYKENIWKNLYNVYKNISESLNKKQYRLLYYYGKAAVFHYSLNIPKNKELRKKLKEIMDNLEFAEAVSFCSQEKKSLVDIIEEKFYINKKINKIMLLYRFKILPNKIINLFGKLHKIVRGIKVE